MCNLSQDIKFTSSRLLHIDLLVQSPLELSTLSKIRPKPWSSFRIHFSWKFFFRTFPFFLGLSNGVVRIAAFFPNWNSISASEFGYFLTPRSGRPGEYPTHEQFHEKLTLISTVFVLLSRAWQKAHVTSRLQPERESIFRSTEQVESKRIREFTETQISSGGVSWQ